MPIDSDYPTERIDYMMSDSASKLLVNEDILQEFISRQHMYSNKNVSTVTKPEGLAYVIYTSGSTGQPKVL